MYYYSVHNISSYHLHIYAGVFLLLRFPELGYGDAAPLSPFQPIIVECVSKQQSKYLHT